MSAELLVVVGTGTDVGKTHVTCCLLAAARARGVKALGYKPIASGVADGVCDDTRAHARASGAAEVPPTFSLTRAVSPHLAARQEGRAIELAPIVRRAHELVRDADVLLVETAGGLFSPIDDAHTNVDLALALAPARVLLVAPDRLGVLHDVRACLIAARAAGIVIDLIALSAPAIADASTGSNAAELERLGLGPVSAVFPRASFDDRSSLREAARLWTTRLG